MFDSVRWTLAARRARRAADMCCHHYERFDASKPSLLCVTPYAIFPPLHGGARRIFELYRRLAPDWNIVILSDEGASYQEVFKAWREGRPNALFTVDGRSEPLDLRNTRIGRVESHSRPALQTGIDHVLAQYPIDIVIIEYIELAGLVRSATKSVPWVLDLHDVLTDGSEPEADRFERDLIDQFDELIVTSKEDASLLGRDSRLIANGVDHGAYPTVPSKDDGPILFAGPFRYAPNAEGAAQFINEALPAILQEVPHAKLRVLVGEGVDPQVLTTPALMHPSVELVREYKDISHELRHAALTINPVFGIRGSPLKVAESLVAGRICLATRDGCRGYDVATLDALIAVDNIAALSAPIAHLLKSTDERHRIEQTGRSALAHLDWRKLANDFDSVLRRHLV